MTDSSTNFSWSTLNGLPIYGMQRALLRLGAWEFRIRASSSAIDVCARHRTDTGWTDWETVPSQTVDSFDIWDCPT